MVSLFLAGCGGGGGGGGSTTPPVTVADLAPSSITNHTLTFADPDQPSVKMSYTFDGSTYTSPSGDSGSYTYSKTSGSTTKAQLQLSSSFSQMLTYQLTFTTASGGTYTDQSAKSGTFTYQ